MSNNLQYHEKTNGETINCNTGKAKYLKNVCWALLIYLAEMVPTQFF
jgi:hypothetical protein